MAKLRCPICRSRQWRKEPSSGMLVCSEGHILQNYRNETTELTETVGHVLRQRRTGNTKLKTKRQRANPAVYHGNRARLLYFQSLQLLLRLQVNALQKLWELPPEFEAISRDVWTLYLTMMREQLHLEITTDFDPAMRPEEDQSLIEGYKEPTINPESKELSDSDQVVGSSDDEKAEISLEPNNDLTDLLNKLSDVSSDSSGEEELQVTEGRDYQRVKLPGTRGNRSTSRQSSPLCTIAVLVISCWMLRIPVLYIDLINLVNDFTLPYLNVVARGIIPGSMIVHMSPALVHSLSIQISPRPLQLHSLSSRITRKLHNTYQIEVPEANTSHILARAIEALHLPTVFYHMTKTFADMLRIPLTLHPSLSTQVVDTSGKLLTMQRGDNIPVELALICAIILLLKLIYGLDGRLRKDISEDDFLPGLPPQEEILSRLRREDEQVSGAEARTALELTPSDIDHYLDFCTKALLGNNMQSQDVLLERTFQIPAQAASANLKPWPTAETGNSEKTKSLQKQDSEDSESFSRGSHHTIFSTTDILGDLPPDYQLVVSQAARWCGVGDDDVASIVERFERRLLRDLERGHKPSTEN